MEWLELKENPNEQKVILQLHGGGYIGAMRNAYRMFAGLYNEVSKGMSVLTIDYRVAPENPYPAALEDAVSAYQWLLGQGWFAEDIIVAGDSAGGGLAMALCHYLKDHGMQLHVGSLQCLRGRILWQAVNHMIPIMRGIRCSEIRGTA